jgi:hypothetical protein
MVRERGADITRCRDERRARAPRATQHKDAARAMRDMQRSALPPARRCFLIITPFSPLMPPPSFIFIIFATIFSSIIRYAFAASPSIDVSSSPGSFYTAFSMLDAASFFIAIAMARDAIITAGADDAAFIDAAIIDIADIDIFSFRRCHFRRFRCHAISPRCDARGVRHAQTRKRAAAGGAVMLRSRCWRAIAFCRDGGSGHYRFSATLSMLAISLSFHEALMSQLRHC